MNAVANQLMPRLPGCDRILPHLYQGEKPPTGPTMRAHGFDVVVLCASEYQPSGAEFAGARVLHAPFHDIFGVPLTFEEKRMIMNTAARVAQAVRSGSRVYVSCWQGINRSGLVTALAVRELTGCTGTEAMRWVQARRQGSLTNPQFQQLLRRLPLMRPASARA